jgi:thiol:disulfide interchange protein
LSDAQVKAALEPFKRLVVDITDRSDREKQQILSEMNIRGLPTLLFLDAEGNETSRLVGPQHAGPILAAAKKAQAGE